MPTYYLLPNSRFTEIEAIFLSKVTQSRHRGLWKQEALSAHEAFGDQVASMTGLRKGEQKHPKQLSRNIPLDWLNSPYSQSLSQTAFHFMVKESCQLNRSGSNTDVCVCVYVYIHTHRYPLVFRFFSHIGHYRVLSRVHITIYKIDN